MKFFLTQKSLVELPKSSLMSSAFFFWSTTTATLLTEVEGDDVDDDADTGSRLENGLSELENPFNKSVLEDINFQK